MTTITEIHKTNNKTLDRLQSSISFLMAFGLSKYVRNWDFSDWQARVTMDKADIPDDVFRNLKRTFGKKNDAGQHALEVTGSVGYRQFTGDYTLNEGTSREFELDLTITNAMTCEQVEVTEDTSEAEMNVIIRRIKSGQIPVTVCDVVKYRGEVDAETTADRI